MHNKDNYYNQNYVSSDSRISAAIHETFTSKRAQNVIVVAPLCDPPIQDINGLECKYYNRQIQVSGRIYIYLCCQFSFAL